MNPLAEDFRLQGERVELRPFVPEDAEAVFAYACDPEVTRFMAWDPAPDLDSVRPFLDEQIARRRRGEALGLAIVLNDTGQMIGSVDLRRVCSSSFLRWRGPRRAELGYLMARDYWGRGLMTEAARLTVAHGLAALGLTQIVAWADADNRASRRVLEKIGMHTRGSEIREIRGQRRLYLRYQMGRGRT